MSSSIRPSVLASSRLLPILRAAYQSPSARRADYLSRRLLVVSSGCLLRHCRARAFSSAASGDNAGEPDSTALVAPAAGSEDDLPEPWSGREVCVQFPMRPKAQQIARAEAPTFPVRPSYADFHSELRQSSQVVVFDGAPDDPHRPSSTPIYQTSTFRQPSASNFGPYDYTRSGNPTRTALEKHAAMLEHAAVAFGFSTGMAALCMVVRLVDGSVGGEILSGNDIYGGMHRLLTQVAPQQGVRHRLMDMTDPQAVVDNLLPHTKIVHVETPSNPMMRICDIRTLAELLRPKGVLLSVDCSAMSPLLMRPLDLGADIVIHSATKHFSGHADCMGGLVCIRDETLAQKVGFLQNAEGTAIAPFEAWLMLRGIKTMSLRMERAQDNARKITAFLAEHPRVLRLHWPGPEAGSKNCLSVKQLQVHAEQADGPGTLISFETGSRRFSRRFMDACRIFKITVSFGSIHSLCEMPCDMSHAAIPDDELPFPRDLVRLAVGIEHWHDLRDDLQQALELAARVDIPDAALSGHYFDSKFEDLPITPSKDSP